jgi:hypothetical protein
MNDNANMPNVAVEADDAEDAENDDTEDSPNAVIAEEYQNLSINGRDLTILSSRGTYIKCLRFGSFGGGCYELDKGACPGVRFVYDSTWICGRIRGQHLEDEGVETWVR